MCRSLLPAAFVAALLAPAAALAADPVAGYTEVDDDSAMVERFGITADELDDLSVYGANGAKIGEVEDVLADSTGAVTAVSVEFDAFEGMDDREVVVALDELALEGSRLTTELTEAEVSGLPEWKD